MNLKNYVDAYSSNLFELADAANINFANMLELDFHLDETSSAVDAGVALANGPIGSDYDGITRSDPPDQGAFEYYYSPASQAVITTPVSKASMEFITCSLFLLAFHSFIFINTLPLF